MAGEWLDYASRNWRLPTSGTEALDWATKAAQAPRQAAKNVGQWGLDWMSPLAATDILEHQAKGIRGDVARGAGIAAQQIGGQPLKEAVGRLGGGRTALHRRGARSPTFAESARDDPSLVGETLEMVPSLMDKPWQTLGNMAIQPGQGLLTAGSALMGPEFAAGRIPIPKGIPKGMRSAPKPGLPWHPPHRPGRGPVRNTSQLRPLTSEGPPIIGKATPPGVNKPDFRFQAGPGQPYPKASPPGPKPDFKFKSASEAASYAKSLAEIGEQMKIGAAEPIISGSPTHYGKFKPPGIGGQYGSIGDVFVTKFGPKGPHQQVTWAQPAPGTTIGQGKFSGSGMTSSIRDFPGGIHELPPQYFP